jgi:hypothetical protein
MLLAKLFLLGGTLEVVDVELVLQSAGSAGHAVFRLDSAFKARTYSTSGAASLNCLEGQWWLIVKWKFMMLWFCPDFVVG